MIGINIAAATATAVAAGAIVTTRAIACIDTATTISRRSRRIRRGGIIVSFISMCIF